MTSELTSLPLAPSVPELCHASLGSGVVMVSFSGGRTSAFLARLMQLSPIWESWRKVYVFSNTGREREETLRFVHECDTRWNLNLAWVEAVVNPEKGQGTKHRVVTYETAVRNTDPATDDHPFIAVVKKYGLPTNAFPHCTRELKQRPIASYMDTIYPTGAYLAAIGIRADEAHRAKPKPGYAYPLVDLRVDEETVRRFWDKQDFDLGLKDYQGNCDLCFKKSLRKRLTILRETPEIAAFWADLEGERVNPRGITVDVGFDRSGLRVGELVEMSRNPSLEPAVDKHDARLLDATIRPQLFERALAIDWDFEKPCHCQNA